MNNSIKKAFEILLFVILFCKCGSPVTKNTVQNVRTDKWIGTWAYHDTMAIQKDSTGYFMTNYRYEKGKLTGQQTLKLLENKKDSLVNPMGKLFLLNDTVLVFKKDTFHFVNTRSSFIPADKAGLKELERVMNIQ